jgi:phage FluMu gp28-like protein
MTALIIPNTASAATPPVMLPYQQRWIADKRPLKIAEKSRRTGLTWGEAADNVLAAASARDAGGQNAYYIAYNLDMTIEYIQACAMWARAFDYAAGEIEEGIWDDEADRDRDIKTLTIKFPSGFRIVALSSRPTNLRGKQGIVVIDEAAFHDKLDELLKAALALLIWGGSVRVISTHNGIGNPFNQLINDTRAGKRGKKAGVHRIEFQQAVKEGLYQRVCARMGQRWSKKAEAAWVEEVYELYGDASGEELDVIPSSGEGAFLSSILIEARMHDAPVLRWSCSNEFATYDDHRRWRDCQDWIEGYLDPVLSALNPHLTHHYGMDFGRSVDLSVIATLAVESNLVRRCPFLVELRNVPFKQQEQILFHVLDRLPRFAKGANDARGNGQQLAEFAWQKYGQARVEPVMLSEEWYRSNMPAFQAAFQDSMIQIPRDVDVRDDLRAIKLIKGVGRIPEGYKGKGADGKPRHADAAIALALAYYASQQAPLAFDEIQTTGHEVLGASAYRDPGAVRGDVPVHNVGWGTVAGSNVLRGW